MHLIACRARATRARARIWDTIKMATMASRTRTIATALRRTTHFRTHRTPRRTRATVSCAAHSVLWL
jgi:hypothetical protein